MKLDISLERLLNLGLSPSSATHCINEIENAIQACQTPALAWQAISRYLSVKKIPFEIHLYFFSLCFPHWQSRPDTAPAYLPSQDTIINANISSFMRQTNRQTVPEFHRWTYTCYADFWAAIIKKLNVPFKKRPQTICDLTEGIESPSWLPGGSLNIADSCFTADPTAQALLYEDNNQQLCSMSYGALDRLSNQVANSLEKLHFQPQDAIGLIMPMNATAIAIYLGIIKMGGIVVAIAESFSIEEINTRLAITQVKAVFTQDYLQWGNKKIALYEKISRTIAPVIILVPLNKTGTCLLRKTDQWWENFLVDENQFVSAACTPDSACQILFSSGTTAAPKAIPWSHLTPIKAASDGYFHQNIQAHDILAWPTSLGWMMGPWLLFAAFINHASIALYPDAPTHRQFGLFIQKTKVSILGVVPTLVAAWRQSACMEGLDWQTIKLFSSTGECSNPEDMLYLMSLAGYRPIIEYCGGTEIGGAYVSSTVIENNYLSLFSTPAMGLHLLVLDEKGHLAPEGEAVIVPPSIGLSVKLLNADHHQIYFAGMPRCVDGSALRRHGDFIKQLANGYYCLLGRTDDTMNLGGIKISAAEIERAIAGIPNITETAAIAVTLHRGPAQLVIYAAAPLSADKKKLMPLMQERINGHLNPLFKIHDVIIVSALPKTSSNKIMRRALREQYDELRK